MLPFFGSTDTCIDFINVAAYPKYEDKSPEKWSEILKGTFEDESFTIHALSQKDDASCLTAEQILVDQLRARPGGQLVECCSATVKLVLCELQSEQWVLVHFSEGG